MTDIARFSTDDLRSELERREQPQPPVPQPLENPNWDPLIGTMRDGIADAVKHGYIDKNLKEYIFESALEAVYGSNVWTWWNAQDRPS